MTTRLVSTLSRGARVLCLSEVHSDLPVCQRNQNVCAISSLTVLIRTSQEYRTIIANSVYCHNWVFPRMSQMVSRVTLQRPFDNVKVPALPTPYLVLYDSSFVTTKECMYSSGKQSARTLGVLSLTRTIQLRNLHNTNAFSLTPADERTNTSPSHPQRPYPSPPLP